MKKFLSGLLASLTLCALALPAGAQTVTITGVTPPPGGVLSSAGSAWWISVFNINVSDATNVITTNASAVINYYVGGIATQYSKTPSISKVGNSIQVGTGSDMDFNDFLEQGQAAGATEWKVIVTNLSIEPEGDFVSNVNGCTVEAGIITLTYYYGDDAGGGTTTMQEAAWKTPFTASSEKPYWSIPSLVSVGADDTNFYIVTDSQTDLCWELGNFIYSTESFEPGSDIQMTPVKTSSGYVYNGSVFNPYGGIYLMYNEATPIQFTFYPGEYSDQSRETITVGKQFPLTPNTKFYYTAGTTETSFYFISNSDINIIDNLEWATSDGFSLGLQEKEGTDGNYVYLSTNDIGGNTYYLLYTGSENIQFTMYLGEYDGSTPAPSANQITLGKEFVAGPDATNWTYTSLSDIDVYLVVNSPADLVETGALKLNYYGSDIFEYWDTYTTPTGYVYAGNLQQDGEYTLVYTGSENVTMNLIEGQYTSDGAAQYMDYADVLTTEISASDPNAAIDLQWDGDVVMLVDEEATSIPVYFNDDLLGLLSAEYLQFIGAGADQPGELYTRAETGDKGTVMVILAGASELFTQPGVYEIDLPASIVVNEDGYYNKAQEVFVTVTNFVAPKEVSPKSGAMFVEGEEVVFTLTYEGQIVPIDGQDSPVMVYNGTNTFEETYKWTDKQVEIATDGEALIIDLGNALKAGTYYLSVRESQFTVDDVDNELVEIIFTVSSESDSINSINIENGDVEIYNLQGMKVNHLGKGLYIINGKKVMVK